MIDDTEELLELTRRLLQSRGYETVTLNTGKDAIEIIRKEQPDLIILDMLLPDKDGSDICKEIKSDNSLRKIPVILSTGQLMESQDILNPESVGADDFLMKPFEIDDLLNKIQKWLSQ